MTLKESEQVAGLPQTAGIAALARLSAASTTGRRRARLRRGRCAARQDEHSRRARRLAGRTARSTAARTTRGTSTARPAAAPAAARRARRRADAARDRQRHRRLDPRARGVHAASTATGRARRRCRAAASSRAATCRTPSADHGRAGPARAQRRRPRARARRRSRARTSARTSRGGSSCRRRAASACATSASRCCRGCRGCPCSPRSERARTRSRTGCARRARRCARLRPAFDWQRHVEDYLRLLIAQTIDRPTGRAARPLPRRFARCGIPALDAFGGRHDARLRGIGAAARAARAAAARLGGVLPRLGRARDARVRDDRVPAPRRSACSSERS